MSRIHHNGLSSRPSTEADVYYVPASVLYAPNRDLLALETVLAHQMFHLLSALKKQDVVGVKPCENYPECSARYACAFADLLGQRGQTGFICGTSNRHNDYRDNGIRAAAALDACRPPGTPVPFMVLDGIYGEHEISSKNVRHLGEDVYLAAELANLDGLVSVCCFAPSPERNRSSAIVNLGQGLASKRGKIHQRTTRCPQVNIQKCYACRRCVRQCPSHAISISDGHVVINADKCIKCGKCVELAHYGGIIYDWNASPEHYNRAVASHAEAAIAVLEGKVVCVNIVMRDDGGDMAFAGAMVSRDPVAADLATIEFCEANSLLSEEHALHVKQQVSVAHAAGVGTAEHKIITVAY